jgi:hypothetical protein
MKHQEKIFLKNIGGVANSDMIRYAPVDQLTFESSQLISAFSVCEVGSVLHLDFFAEYLSGKVGRECR